MPIFKRYNLHDRWGGDDPGGSSGGGLGGISGGDRESRDSTPAPSTPEPAAPSMSVKDQYAAYGAGRQLAEIAGGYGPASQQMSDWDRFIANSPSFSTGAKLALGAFVSPIGGMYNAVKYNAARLENMTEAERNLERNIRAEIDANRVQSDRGNVNSGLQSPNVQRSIFSIGGGSAGGTGVPAGSGGGGGALVVSGQGSETAGGSGTGAGSLVVTGESPLAQLAALVTIGAALVQFLG